MASEGKGSLTDIKSEGGNVASLVKKTTRAQHEVAGVAKWIVQRGREKCVSILSGSAWHDTISWRLRKFDRANE
jgi:hypothetical protein